MDANEIGEQEKNFASIENDMEGLIEKYRGRWVVYNLGKFDSDWKCCEDAVSEGYRKYGNSGFIVCQVPGSLLEWDMREPYTITRLLGF